jgi:hypothetical protein
MTTALELITGAARLIGIVRKGEALDNDEAVDGLEALNQMLESWTNSTLLVNARIRESFTLVGGTASYSIGTGQTFNTTRPNIITEAFIRDGSIDTPLTIISDEQYDSVSFKTGQGLPQFLNYTPSYPYGTIKLYNTPGSAYGLHILSEKPLTEFASLATDIELPAGWKRALRFNLAVEIAPEFSQQVPAEVVEIAQQSKALIALNVARNRPIKFSPRVAPAGDIYSGYYS